jgi:hypothetical protein
MGKRGSGAGAAAGSKTTPVKKARPTLPLWVNEVLDTIHGDSAHCPFTQVCKWFGPLTAGPLTAGPTLHQGLADAVNKFLEDQGSDKRMIPANAVKFPTTRPEEGLGSKLYY